MEENFAIAKAIIINQICIEANEALKPYSHIYRFSLKHHCNSVIDELEKRMPECDKAFESAEEYFTYSQQRIEMLIPLLSQLRIDEITNITHFIEAYKTDPEGCYKFLCKTLKIDQK